MTHRSDAFDRETYDEVVADIPEYEQLRAEVAAATTGLRVARVHCAHPSVCTTI
jgi:hypothetical protein